MGSRILQLLLIICIQIWITTAQDNDRVALKALKDAWPSTPRDWVDGSHPCGDGWSGITCTNNRVTSINLASMQLTGVLPGDIEELTELETLNLSYNKALVGSLTPKIGNLKKLRFLILLGCSFSGPIPEEIGNLQMLQDLSLNINGFIGSIPASIGNLKKLYWLDLSQNKLTGRIPVSNETTPGLDMLTSTKHFHLGDNQLSGDIPPQLFSSNMTLVHLLLEHNNLTGSIPPTLGLVQFLEVVRLDRNSLEGIVPSNISDLVHVNTMYLSNNQLTGPVPNLTGMKLLNFIDLSNNRLNGTLDISSNPSNQLQLVDLRNNQIADFTQRSQYSIGLILVDNPICKEPGVAEKYCLRPVNNNVPYSTPTNNCVAPSCGSGLVSSPNCICAHPYEGSFFFKALFLSDLENFTIYNSLHDELTKFFQKAKLPVDSVSLKNPRRNSEDYLVIDLEVFPSGEPYFNRTGISAIGNAFSIQDFKPENVNTYTFEDENYYMPGHKASNTGVIIGSTVGGCVLVILLLLAVMYAFRQKGRAERATQQSLPFALWDPTSGSGGVPQFKGTRSFTFEEVKKYTSNFPDINNIGSGGYGMVYRGSLPNGQLIAIKRAQKGSTQGGLEFKTEIELLSRVHHKNVVGLIGFCFDQGEQMLVYEYIVNGTLKDSLSGRSGITMDWMRRLKVALGAARGLQYLHDLADPPIIHRDVKTNNILLDARLVAKVADFGLSKPLSDANMTHVTTQVKGTLGYMDPEYYMTQQLTEKSDVYSFGVVMLELITARNPIENGKNIVKEVKQAMNKSKQLYDLHEALDPTIGLSSQLTGLERFVDLSLRCVEETGNQRPTMSQVVKELENIMEFAGLNPGFESSSSASASYEHRQ